MFDDFMPGVRVSDWLKKNNYRKVLYAAKHFGSNNFKRGVVNMNIPRMQHEHQIELVNSKTLKELFHRVIEMSRKYDTGEIIPDKDQSWRTAFAFLKT